MSVARFLALIAVFPLFVACASRPMRAPQTIANEYDPTRVKLLRLAAENGILFQISEAVIRDVPTRSMGDRCRKALDPVWGDKIYSTLEVFENDPKLLQKVHSIEFRRGDRAGVEVSKDLDGAVSLVLLYGKTETRQRVENLSDVPCADGSLDFIGKEMTLTGFEWPVPGSISAKLKELPDRPKVDRFEADHRFLIWLADRQALLRLTPELVFEKTANGTPLLVTALSKLGDESGGLTASTSIDFWMKEIAEKSRVGASVNFFGLQRDTALSSGLQVDSVGRFARKMSGFAEPTYPFISFKTEKGNYVMGTLADLTNCLNDLMKTYRSPMSAMGAYDMDPESFLYPGHTCQTEGQSPQ